jgi:SAM-dependent methyltransferase
MILIYRDVNFTRKNIVTIAKLIFQNKSPIRIFHNIFLETIQIEDRVLDLGCGNHSSYLNFIKKNKANIFFADKTIKKGKNFIKVDLEKKINIKDSSFDNILLFNVLEHIHNYQNLINEIYRILNNGGKLEIFVPFMHRFHSDPYDYFRPTHEYLQKIFIKSGFEDIKINIIGLGPFAVISEILHQYFKFKLLKLLFFFIFIVLNKIIKKFSKDYYTFYGGIHCTCKK